MDDTGLDLNSLSDQLTKPVVRSPMQMPPMEPLGRWMAGQYNTGVNEVAGPQSWLGQTAGNIGSGIAGELGDAISPSMGDKFADAGRSVASGFPRVGAGMLAGTVTGTGPAPLIADATAGTYADTGSVGKSLLAGAAQALPIAGAKYGGSMAEEWALKRAAQAAGAGELTTASVLPKIGGTLGGAGAGMEAQRQVNLTTAGVPWNDPSRNPLSVHNMVAQMFGAAMYGANELGGHGTDWWKDQEYNPQPGFGAEAGGQARITSRSAPSDVNTATATPPSDWRTSYARDGLDDISSTTDPIERNQKVSRLSDTVYNTSNLDNLGDSVEKEAKMAYVAPPTTPQGLVDLAKRVNTLQADALRLMDEKATSGEEGSTSSAAYKQLKDAGWIKQEITYDWLKDEFGKGVERSLTNSNANAYLLLTQKLANRMFLLADAAKGMRGEQAVDTPESAKNVLDRTTTTNFVQSVGQVQDKTLRDQLWDRFKFHESLDNRKGTDTSKTYMNEITQLVNHISGGKAPEEVGWKYDTAPFMKQKSMMDDQGQEIRPAIQENRSLNDYVAMDSGKYTLPVYGRPNRSQREIVASQMGQEGTSHQGGGEDDAKQQIAMGMKSQLQPEDEFDKGGATPIEPTNTKFENLPDEGGLGAGKRMDDIGKMVQDHIAKTSNDEIWNTIRPEFLNSYGSVHPILEGRLQPVAKDLAQAVFELGAKSQGGANTKATLSPAGQRVSDALGVNIPGRSPASALAQKLNMIFGTGGRDANTVKQGIIRRVAQEAGVGQQGPDAVMSSPQYPRAFQTDELKPNDMLPVSARRAAQLWEQGRPLYKDLNDGEALGRIDSLESLQGTPDGNHYLYQGSPDAASAVGQSPTGKLINGEYVPGNTAPSALGTGVATHGASSTSDPTVDYYNIAKPFFYRLGYSPEEADRFLKLGVQTIQNFNQHLFEINQTAPEMSYNEGAVKKILQGQNPAMTGSTTNTGLYYSPSITANNKGLIGLALDHVAGPNDPKALVSFYHAAVLSHELLHDIQYQGGTEAGRQGSSMPGTAYSNERVMAWNQLQKLAYEYTPSQKYTYLKILAHAVIPRELLYSGQGGTMHPVIDGNMKYGAGFEGYSSAGARQYEFVNVFSGMIASGMISGGNGYKLTPEQVFMHLPEEQALFAKGVYRDLHDNLGALHAAVVAGKAGPVGIGNFKYGDVGRAYNKNLADTLILMVKAAHTLVVSMEPSASVHRASQLMAAMGSGMAGNWAGPRILPDAKIAADPNDPDHVPDAEWNTHLDAAHATMKSAQALLFGDNEDPRKAVTPDGLLKSEGQMPPKGPKDPNQLSFPFNDTQGKPMGTQQVDLGQIWKRAPLFMQALQHLTTRGIPLAQDVMQAVKDIEPSQTRLAMQALSPFMTTNGKFDPTNPTMQMKPGTPVRDAFNKVLNWLQRNKAQAFEQDKQRAWGLSKDAKADLQPVLDRVSADIPTLIGAVHNVTATHRILGEQLLQDRVDSGASRMARMIMAIEPGKPYDQAKSMGTDIIRGLMAGNAGQPQLARGLTPLLGTTRESVLGLADSGIVDGLVRLQEQLNTNDWFATEQRPGNYLVTSFKDGIYHVDGAKNFAAAQTKRQQLTALGHTDITVDAKSDKNARDFSAPESILQHYIDVEREALERYLTSNPQQLSPETIAQLRAYAPQPGAAVEGMLDKKGTNKYLLRRQDVPTGLGHDYLDNMRDYISRLSSTIARTSIQRKVALILADARLDGQDKFKQYVNDNVSSSMIPTGGFERSLRATASAYFIALNLSSSIVIGSHGLQTLPETLTKFDTSGGWMGNAMGHLGKGIGDLTYLTSKSTASERAVLERSAQAKLNAGVAMTPKEMKVLAFKKAVDDKLLDAGVFQNLTHDDDVRAMMARQFGIGDQVSEGAGTLLANGLYRVSKFGMGLHSFASGFNNKVGFLAGLDQAISQGKSFDEAYQHADNVRTQALFAGGRANQPGYMAAQTEGGGGFGGPTTTPIMRTMYTLQRYTTGFMGRYLEHTSDILSNDPNLTSQQRVQAVKSLTTLLTTQIALAGLMGLPGVAAVLALLQKKGVNAQAAVREGIAHLAGAGEDDSGFRGQLTETAMNGLPNQMFGVNIGPRLGVTDYMGTSAYDGFNLADLTGPTGSMAINLINGITNILQGKGQKGITELAPNFAKRPIDMAMNKLRYGDYGFRDPQGEKLYDPTTADLLRYAGGLNPSGLSERQTMKRLVSQSNTTYQENQKQKLDTAAAALQRGDRQPSLDWARQQVGIGATSDPISAVRHVADRAAQMDRPQDPLSSGPVGNAENEKAIVSTFPQADLQRRSELGQIRNQVLMEAQAGVPKADYSKDIGRAAVMDALIQKNGMTRSQAERVAKMLGF